ncbi:MAG TPA: transglycosylase, partial [Ruminococcaceae bacterium]|nr:transglycosylase [Oscillospiraceae bacterium]
SGGWGNDPMQASECGYNTQYPNTPNGITDSEYSVNVGVQNLAVCLSAAEVQNPVDMDNIKLALQGYNYGNGYISWAKSNYGGYTYANAVEFSTKQAERLGWSSYGDTQYVSHVLQYYPFGRMSTGVGNT